jgi:hypothetical protein
MSRDMGASDHILCSRSVLELHDKRQGRKMSLTASGSSSSCASRRTYVCPGIGVARSFRAGMQREARWMSIKMMKLTTRE